MTAWCILVADDDPLVVRMLRDVLSTMPATVLEAQDGEEAIRLAKAERPDLILLDVMMPRLDGFLAAAALKEEPSTAEIPLVFISALGGARDKVRGLTLGAEDYLAKPIDPDELKARVGKILRRVRPASGETPLVSGQLQAMNLLSLVQLFEGERRTARLLLTRDADRGEVVFLEGTITEAVHGHRRGEAAVYQLLTWTEGTFRMAPPEGSAQKGGRVKLSNQTLLMEGVRRLDETAGLRSSLPDVTVPMQIPAELREALESQARPEAAALVALLDGTRDLDHILAESPFDDWMTLKILHHLLAVRALAAAAVSGEGRVSPRVGVEVPVEYQRLPPMQKATTFNLSAHGVFIQTASPFDMGERVVLRFQLPGEGAPIQAMGQVVWRNADTSHRGGAGMGIRFLDLAAADRGLIERHVAQTIAAQISWSGERP